MNLKLNNKFVPAIIIGALAGGALSLIDKNTRQSMKNLPNDVQKVQSDLQVRNDPNQGFIGKIQDEVLFWKETIEDIRRENPELERQVMNAKDTLMEKRNQKRLK
ncbi:hypothetical protein [Abyssicoccus albus]|uniref:Uncharacterized protein n=1 Tax=Abyssicoccus albus TaxID=1817405 RepID=A0A1Q1G0D9_9BACL|nr:hypothetical protein [Abyssicoccus albus]AQL55822.1 hypothetical protein BVH56_02135 [Abyssicoccus albus]RPF55147.1 hypothetical protein EDD62_1471 [Abyssicoccus albus]